MMKRFRENGDNMGNLISTWQRGFCAFPLSAAASQRGAGLQACSEPLQTCGSVLQRAPPPCRKQKSKSTRARPRNCWIKVESQKHCQLQFMCNQARNKLSSVDLATRKLTLVPNLKLREHYLMHCSACLWNSLPFVREMATLRSAAVLFLWGKQSND